MASFAHPSTLIVVRSVHSPDYSDPWVLLSESEADDAEAIPLRYRKWDDAIVEMSQSEKDAVDAAIAAAASAAVTSGAKTIYADGEPAGRLARAVALVILDELNAHAAKINQIKAAMSNAVTLLGAVAALNQIADYPTRSASQIKTAVENKLDTF